MNDFSLYLNYMVWGFFVFQVSDRLLVVNHIENPSVFPQSFHKEEFSSHNVMDDTYLEVHTSSFVENGITELAGGEEDKDYVLHVSIS